MIGATIGISSTAQRFAFGGNSMIAVNLYRMNPCSPANDAGIFDGNSNLNGKVCSFAAGSNCSLAEISTKRKWCCDRATLLFS